MTGMCFVLSLAFNRRVASQPSDVRQAEIHDDEFRLLGLGHFDRLFTIHGDDDAEIAPFEA